MEKCGIRVYVTHEFSIFREAELKVMKTSGLPRRVYHTFSMV